MTFSSHFGVVAIGRNEGERLIRCLESVVSAVETIVYVDSGSTDASVQRAECLGVHVINLSLDVPFTAGRARNAGFEALLGINPELKYVQFLDGDCTIDPAWLCIAGNFLDSNPKHAIVCGHRKELYPDRTLYNRLCDLEWHGPAGDAAACGGDFMVRADVFAGAGGFNPKLIAGEEPEMCHRIIRSGYLVHRLDVPMTFHDAAMFRLGQWIRRTSRSGYAYAARAAIHRADGTKYCWRENARIAFWAAFVPLAAIVLALTISPWWLLILLLYPVQAMRQWRRLRKEHPSEPVAAAALFTVMGKWPEFHGQCLFLIRALGKREQRIIEYK